jgi:phosphatidylserine decarboxylase
VEVASRAEKASSLKIALTRYGRREIVLATIAAAVAVGVLAWLYAPAVVLPAAIWVWVLWFFRDPDRRVPSEQDVLVSPADGRVADITPVGMASELGQPGVKIGIFMSIFDVHVNRSPAKACVESVVYRPGGFLDARNPAAGERNESATIRLTCQRGRASYPLIVRQVAGLIARRIVTDVTIGRELHAGQRIGMIKFGSRVELIAPVELAEHLRVAQGQKVRAGETVLLAASGRTDHGF